MTNKNFEMFVERTRQGMTQGELGKKIGTAGNYISKIENNLATPSYEMAVKISKALGKETHELFPKFEKYK